MRIDEADDRDHRDADLDEFQPLRDHRLVEAVGDLAAERRQEEIGRDEHRAGERDQRIGRAAVDVGQDQEDQRVLQEIVVERREELAPEQRRETARQQQRLGFGHGRSLRHAIVAGRRINGVSRRTDRPATHCEEP